MRPCKSVSSSCFDPRRGGGESDVTSATSESWRGGDTGGSGRRACGTGCGDKIGVCIWRKLGSFWKSVIFSAIGVEGGEIAVLEAACAAAKDAADIAERGS